MSKAVLQVIRAKQLQGREAGMSRFKGFTLLELLVVIVIIGLLAGYVAPPFFTQIGKSKGRVARARLDSLEKALDQSRLDNRHYPTGEQGLDALVNKPQ